MARPGLYLFSGNDSWASLKAVQRWQAAFQAKYGFSDLVTLDTDEMTAPEVATALQEYMQVGSLFSSARLLVLKRVTAHDKGKTASFSEAVVPILDKVSKQAGDELFVAIWEPRGLSNMHPLKVAFQDWAEAGLAKLQDFNLSEERGITQAVRSFLAATDQEIESDALHWLQSQYLKLGQEARLAKRLKAQDGLLEDERAWWLRQVLGLAAARADHAVSLSDLQAVQAQIGDPVGVFDIGGALSLADWGKVRRLVASFIGQAEGDSSAYFGLYAALTWQLRQRPGRLTGESALLGLRLLAEIEIISKNTDAEHAWLLGLFIELLADQKKENRSIIEPRQLWLSQLPRS